MPSIEELLHTIDPCIARCAELGIANYSATARLLAEYATRTGVKTTPAAAKMRILRWRDALEERPCFGLTCNMLLKLLASTRVELREGIAVVTLEKGVFAHIEPLIPKLMVEARLLHILQSVNAVTVIIDEEHIEEITSRLEHTLDELRNQAALILISPREILDTPGFIAYITSLLALNNVNITQVVSCYTDTTIIVSARDAQKAHMLISKAIQAARRLLESAPEINRSPPAKGHPGSPLITREENEPKR